MIGNEAAAAVDASEVPIVTPSAPRPQPPIPAPVPPVPVVLPYPQIPSPITAARSMFQARPWLAPVGTGVVALLIGISIGAAIGRRASRSPAL